TGLVRPGTRLVSAAVGLERSGAGWWGGHRGSLRWGEPQPTQRVGAGPWSSLPMREDGGMTWSEPQPDVLGDSWVARTLDLNDAAGPGVATLVHRSDTGARPRAML